MHGMYVCAYMCMCVWVCMHVGAHVNVWACVWNPKADIRSPSLSMFSIKAGSHSELADMLFSWPASFEDLLSLPSEHWDCGMPSPPDICGGSGISAPVLTLAWQSLYPLSQHLQCNG